MDQAAGASQHPASYWAATAVGDRDRPELDGDLSVDVAVIGGGFTGLSAAYHLQELGLKAAVLEQHRVGWGASGRNAGMLIPGFKYGFAELAQRWGLEGARALLRLKLESADLVEQIITRHNIACHWRRCGSLAAAWKPSHMEELREAQRFNAQQLGYETWIVEKDDLATELDSPVYHGGKVDPHACGFHPLNYALGLARAVEERGGLIFHGSPVRGLQRAGDDWVLQTPRGRVRARHVVVGTNGHTPPVVPRLHRSIMPVGNNVIVTQPLDEELARRLIPNDRMVYDTKRLLYYFRLTPDRRMLFGGRGVLSGREGPPSFRVLQRAMTRIFPDLAGARIEYAWGGYTGFTLDFLPHIGRTRDGIWFALGYCGSGAALSTMMGRLLALDIAGRERSRYPLEELDLKPIPLYGARGLVLRAATLYFKWRDYVD